MLGKKKQKPSLRGVLSGFHKNIDDLAIVIEDNNQSVEYNKETIISLEEQNELLEKDTKTATKVKDNLTKLIGANEGVLGTTSC